MEDYLTPKEVAGILKVNYRTVLREIKRGNLPASKVGRIYLIDESDLDDYMRGEAHAVPLKVAVAVVRRDDEFIIVKRRKPQEKLKWQFPSGTIKYSEKTSTRAELECLSETGVLCKAKKMLGKRVHPNTKVVIYYWYCEYLDGEEYNADDYENDGVEWVTGEEALRRFTTDVYEPVEKILKDYC